MDTVTVKFTQFRPGEAAEIAGISAQYLRDLRRRGKGVAATTDERPHPRYDALPVAEMMVRKMLSDRGIGPERSMEGGEHSVASLCALGIVWHALQYPVAYLRNAPVPLDSPCRWELLCARRLLAGRLERAPDFMGMGSATATPRFLVWWPDGAVEWWQSLDGAFGAREDPRYREARGAVLERGPGGGEYRPVSAEGSPARFVHGGARYEGAAVVLDLMALGSALIDRLGDDRYLAVVDPVAETKFPRVPRKRRKEVAA